MAYPWLVLVLWLAPASASAHAVSNSYLGLTADGGRIAGDWRIALRDLDAALGLDLDGDGRVSDSELRDGNNRVLDYALSRLELQSGSRPCPLMPIVATPTGSYLNVQWTSECALSAPLSLRYDLFFDHDRTHQGHLSVPSAGAPTHVFTAQERVKELELGAPARGPLLEYLIQGVWHILIGWDHILFLLTLLMGAVLEWRGSGYEPVAGFRTALGRVVKVVTAFTAAHSITLSLAALEWVVPPTRWVETAIALSVVLAAANNLWPVVTRRTWLLAFVFGLIHGFGFASVFSELGLRPSRLLVSLLGFNLGVEVGQLGLVVLCFPVAFALRRRPSYRLLGARVGSALIGAVGLVWSLERGLDVDFRQMLLRSSDPALGARQRPSATLGCDSASLLGAPTVFEAVMARGTGALSLEHRRAFTLACTGELDASAEAHAGLLRSLGEAGPRSGLALAHLTFAEVEAARGALDRARPLLARGVELLRAASEPELLAGALSRSGELAARDADWADAHRLYEEARGLHEALGERASLAKALSRLGDALLSGADPLGAKTRYEKARDLYESLGDPEGIATEYQNLAVVARLLGDTAEAARMYRRAIESHTARGHEPEAALAMAALGRVYLGSAQYAEARAVYEQANLIERRLDRKRFLAKNYNQLGNLHQLRGELEPAAQMYQEGLRASEDSKQLDEAAKSSANLASVFGKRGEVEQARAMYERSLSLFEQSGSVSKARRVRGLLASLDRRQGLDPRRGLDGAVESPAGEQGGHGDAR